MSGRSAQLFSPAQLSELRDKFAAVKWLDPDSAVFKQFRAFVASLPQSQVEQLADADIPWLSYLCGAR